MEQVNSGSSNTAIAVKEVIESPLVIANLQERSLFFHYPNFYKSFSVNSAIFITAFNVPIFKSLLL